MNSSQIKRPYFSIVIPVYNREKEIIRAVNSCLVQSFTDIEIIVVDDASTDQSVEAVKSITDPRMVLVCHAINRNVCPARNTGAAHSQGDWLLFLDSDDEFLPGALEKMHRHTMGSAENMSFGFLRQRDDGRLSPEPVPARCILDYEGYIHWEENLVLTDFVHCVRRHTFDKVTYPDSRAYEEGYLLNFTQHYKIHIIPEPTVAMHLDSTNRITTSGELRATQKLMAEAYDHMTEVDDILLHHGRALQQHGAEQYRILRKSQMMYRFLLQRRWEGFRLALSYVKRYPTCLQGWVIFVTGMLGARTLATVKRWKYRWSNRQ